MKGNNSYKIADSWKLFILPSTLKGVLRALVYSGCHAYYNSHDLKKYISCTPEE